VQLVATASRVQVVWSTWPLVVQLKEASVAVVEAAGCELIETVGAAASTETPVIAVGLFELPTESVPTAEHCSGPSGVLVVTANVPFQCVESLGDIETAAEPQLTANLLSSSFATTLTVTLSPG
jgi:hypothetical protein